IDSAGEKIPDSSAFWIKARWALEIFCMVSLPAFCGYLSLKPHCACAACGRRTEQEKYLAAMDETGIMGIMSAFMLQNSDALRAMSKATGRPCLELVCERCAKCGLTVAVSINRINVNGKSEPLLPPYVVSEETAKAIRTALV
ncbi:MAG: hypothetical protein JXR97_09060, partial [Planctomycetes bacterium]|nr:hypothetical protein [Planctomycetota bacterium]